MADNVCAQCGAPLPQGAVECKYCGEPAKTQQVVQQPMQTPQPQYQPYQGQSQGQPYQGQPYQGQPYQGQPYQGQPPYQGQSYQPQQGYASYNQNMYAEGVNPAWPIKNKIVAGILGICLGGLGIHKFYLNKVGMGIIYLLFCWTGIPAFVGLIEGIIYLTSNDHNFQIKHQVRLQ